MDELIAIHHVEHLPYDLRDLEVQVIIPQKMEEIYHGQNKVATLIDVEYHQTGIATIPNRRKAKLLPRQSTREGIFRALEVAEECASGMDCLLWKNNVIWPKQKKEIVDLYNGDYIRAAIPTKR